LSFGKDRYFYFKWVCGEKQMIFRTKLHHMSADKVILAIDEASNKVVGFINAISDDRQSGE
jgi:hypothetical protein